MEPVKNSGDDSDRTVSPTRRQSSLGRAAGSEARAAGTPGDFSAWIICGMLLLATMLNYMDRQALAVSLSTLKVELSLDEASFGKIEGYFGYGFAIGSVLFGFIADRVGPRYLYPIVLAGWSAAGVATGLAGDTRITSLFESPGDPTSGILRWLILCRFVLGIFEAGHWPCAFLTLRAVLTNKDRTLGSGILQSGASVGAIFVPLYVGLTEKNGYSWQFPFWSIGIVGLAWVPLWLITVWHRDLSIVAPEKTARSDSVEPPGNLILRIMTLAVIIVTLNISWQFLRAWMALFLQDHLQYSRDATLGINSGYFVASDIGCLAAGAIVTVLAARGWTVDSARTLGYVLFVVLAGAAALIPITDRDSTILLVALLYLAGAGVLGLHPYYYSMVQNLPERYMGVLSGALSAWGWVASGLFQSSVGRLIKERGNYDAAFLIVGLLPVIGMFALILFWPRASRSAQVRNH